jgi:hypothetical protein
MNQFEEHLIPFTSNPATARKHAARAQQRYETAIVHLALRDAEYHIQERIAQLAALQDPQKALLELIRMIRDIRWSASLETVVAAIYNDIEMALLPQKRETRRETAYDIVYQDGLSLEGKAFRLYELLSRVQREIVKEGKQHRAESSDNLPQLRQEVKLRQEVMQRLGIEDPIDLSFLE